MSMRFLGLLILSLSGLLWSDDEARAEMVLTSSATGAGYKLTTFATGFPSIASIGPAGMAFTGNTVMVAGYGSGNISVFSDQDGQTYGKGLYQNSGAYSSAASGLATTGGIVYLSNYSDGRVYALNNDGTEKAQLATGLGSIDGLVTDPINGHLLVSSNANGGTVYDINPSNGAVTNLTTSLKLQFSGVSDGLTFSADGQTLYAAINGNTVQGVDMKTGKLTLSISISGADGTALGTGSLAGNLFVNTNFGYLYEVNLTGTPVATELASGGSRGDFVAVDPTNGSLLITQSDRILRLTAPAGGGFGSVPEPSSILMIVTALPMGLAYVRIRRRRAGLAPRA